MEWSYPERTTSGMESGFDENKLHAHPAGSYFTEPANTAHFGMTKSEERSCTFTV